MLDGLDIPFESIDIARRVETSTVDRVAQIDSGSVPGRELGNRLGKTDPCEEHARDGLPNDLHREAVSTCRNLGALQQQSDTTAGLPETRKPLMEVQESTMLGTQTNGCANANLNDGQILIYGPAG